MSVVRILPRDAEALADAYQSTATLLTNTISELTPLVARAKGLIASPWHPTMNPIQNLADATTGCSNDQHDLAWRLDWIHTHDHLDVPDGTRNLFDFITQAEQEAHLFCLPDDLTIPALTPLQEAELALEQIRYVLDTAKFDAQHGGIGTTVADGIWSTEDLDTIIANDHGYYSATQVAHARTVLAMAQSSPEARAHLGITNSGGGWNWNDIGHITLDVLGMVPVVGNAADGINATWYAAEGKYLDAALSSMALIPIIGQAVPPVRGAIKAAAESAGIVFRSLDEALTWARNQFQEITGVVFSPQTADAARRGSDAPTNRATHEQFLAELRELDLASDIAAATSHTSDEAVAIARANGASSDSVVHLLDGEINRSGRAVGGHYRYSPNVRIVDQWIHPETGLDMARVEIFSPATGEFVPKSADTTLFPADWTPNQIVEEIESAFQNASLDDRGAWIGTSGSGVRFGGYHRNGSSLGPGWSTGYPIGDLP